MIESTILAGLLHDPEYVRKVIPFLESEYFEEGPYRQLFGLIKQFTDQYKNPPTKTAIATVVESRQDLNEAQYKQLIELIDGLQYDSGTDLQWAVDTTEKFCQDKAVYNAVMSSIAILDGPAEDRGKIPNLLSDALAVSFDSSIGHDYSDGEDQRYEFYHSEQVKIPTGVHLIDHVTGGGFEKGTLNVLLGGTGVGKSLSMCSLASNMYMRGYNVLYITLELSDLRVSERIDANLLDARMDDLKNLSHDDYYRRIHRVKSRTTGKLIVKQYPTASAGAGHFRHLLNELKLKKNFVPDVIFVDYINLCVSMRIKGGASVGSYTYIKAIAEELRGLAVEFDVTLISATQTTRSGFGSSDLSLEDVSESFGLPATADFFAAISTSEELDQLGQYKFKQLKSRYGDINHMRTFVIGVDKPKMRLYDLEQSAQTLIDPNQVHLDDEYRRKHYGDQEFTIEEFIG